MEGLRETRLAEKSLDYESLIRLRVAKKLFALPKPANKGHRHCTSCYYFYLLRTYYCADISSR